MVTDGRQSEAVQFGGESGRLGHKDEDKNEHKAALASFDRMHSIPHCRVL